MGLAPDEAGEPGRIEAGLALEDVVRGQTAEREHLEAVAESTMAYALGSTQSQTG